MPNSQAPRAISWWYSIDELPAFKHQKDAGNMVVLVNPSVGSGIQFGFRAPGYKTLGLDTWQWGGDNVMEVHPPTINQWYHCVYNFDGLTHRFFLNGKEMASSRTEPKKGSFTRLMLGNYPGGDQFFKGKLDELRIYTRVLSLTEIKTLYSGKPDSDDQ